LDRQPGRTPGYAILLDSRGQQYTSEEFSAQLGRIRDEGTQRLVFAIGPADGWSAAARERANLLLSLGRMTLPHQLARVVLAEQVYRALTILAGHPYHSGH
jgi:23S rRNA (pseudouridine1915-N3)-methyltransferase